MRSSRVVKVLVPLLHFAAMGVASGAPNAILAQIDPCPCIRNLLLKEYHCVMKMAVSVSGLLNDCVKSM